MTDFPTPPPAGAPLERQHFNYPLPDDRIAQQGLGQRSKAKLLHYDKGAITDVAFTQLSSRLPPKSLIVLNTTKVFPSRLIGHRATGGKVELFLLNPSPVATDEPQWAMVKPLKKLAVGEKIALAGGAVATIIAKGDGRAQVRLAEESQELSPDQGGKPLEGERLLSWLADHGIVPLPPYIRRPDDSQRAADLVRYQTVYADQWGSVAAPTAGLHFDEEAMASLRAAGHDFAKVTLHVGAGTFLPVKTEQISAHTMHEEHFKVEADALAAIDAARASDRPIVAVGTTSFRCVESLRRLAGDGPLAPLAGRWRTTDLFVYEEQRERRFTEHFFAGMLTNFHQPESTLLMLMAALLGYDEVMAVYRHALAHDYRFLSYGDSGLYTFRR